MSLPPDAPLVSQLRARDSFLRIRDVLSCVGVSRSTWLSWVKRGAAPGPVRLGPSARLVAWRSRDLEAWMDQQVQRSDRIESPCYPFTSPP